MPVDKEEMRLQWRSCRPSALQIVMHCFFTQEDSDYMTVKEKESVAKHGGI
jgi:hypothetical protein